MIRGSPGSFGTQSRQMFRARDCATRECAERRATDVPLPPGTFGPAGGAKIGWINFEWIKRIIKYFIDNIIYNWHVLDSFRFFPGSSSRYQMRLLVAVDSRMRLHLFNIHPDYLIFLLNQWIEITIENTGPGKREVTKFLRGRKLTF